MAATMRTIDYRRDRHTALNPRHSPQSWPPDSTTSPDSNPEQSMLNLHDKISLTIPRD